MYTPKIYTVSQINKYIRGVIENDIILQSFWVNGEVSNYKKHSSGHLYFTLKDEDCAINSIMFRNDALIMPYEIENGMEVNICGYVAVYEKTGQYQLYAQLIEPKGLGSLAKAFEQIKNRLLNEGLFHEDYKREIPKNPKTIAVITSPTGAAIRDIINVLKRRNPSVQIVVVPVLVQGNNAAQSITEAISTVNKWGKADVIILGRGGGSIEDLWAFNEEIVARGIFASEAPVISAVGHETDFTIADFVSDLRAPTPSAAAELAVNDYMENLDKVKALKLRIDFAMKRILENRTNHINSIANSGTFKGVYEKICNRTIEVENYANLFNNKILNILETKNLLLYHTIETLEILSPLNTLKRGYSVAFNSKNKIVKSVKDVKKDELIKINVTDGNIVAVVKEAIK